MLGDASLPSLKAAGLNECQAIFVRRTKAFRLHLALQLGAEVRIGELSKRALELALLKIKGVVGDGWVVRLGWD